MFLRTTHIHAGEFASAHNAVQELVISERLNCDGYVRVNARHEPGPK